MTQNPSRPVLILITTVSHAFQTYLAGQPRHLSGDFEVTVVTSPDPALGAIGGAESVRVVPLTMTRRITPLRDLMSLAALYLLLRRARPDIVQTYSPKAGLLGMWAARLAGVPVRVHGIIGMPLMEARGAKARLLRIAEHLTYGSATDLTCNSFDLRRWVRDHLSDRPITVINNGSVNGVDLVGSRPPSPAERSSARRDVGVADSEVVFTFVGRLVPEKGISELLEAFELVRDRQPAARLVLAGDCDNAADTDFAHQLDHRVGSNPAITHLGWRQDIRRVYRASDVIVLPSHREGLPNVLLEAAAHGLMLIATDIGGCREVVADGSNGLLVPARDPVALASAMAKAFDPQLRAEFGRAARSLIEDRFDQREYWRELDAHYRGLVGPRLGPSERSGGGRE